MTSRQIDLDQLTERNKAFLDKQRAELKARAPLRPAKPQTFDLDGLGLFSDQHKQLDLVDMLKGVK